MDESIAKPAPPALGREGSGVAGTFLGPGTNPQSLMPGAGIV